MVIGFPARAGYRISPMSAIIAGEAYRQVKFSLQVCKVAADAGLWGKQEGEGGSGVRGALDGDCTALAFYD